MRIEGRHSLTNLINSTVIQHMANIDHVPKDDSDIASTCLDYLSLEDFTSGPCESHALLKTRLENFPFLAYAAPYWGEHIRSLEKVPRGFDS